MAFEKLYLFVDRLAERYKKTENMEILFTLIDYYETVMAHAKFKSQREHCYQTIKKLNAAFFDGYFGKKK